MSILEGIFSLRIVTADFYLEKPKPGLDPCFSEFRGKEIKKVPIIRIFGSTAEGIKTCMHVHGIFPYLYIPFDRKDFETLDKAVYLIASSLDKAINISLGQSSSASQHVFKIQLVKGIPFYGYHQNEHQYLKMYMLNPRFVRRAANLLQNGAIMGKTFHPHESHVPYILQFFIDYNLYGMSFLHVPKEVLKFRRKNEEDNIPYDISKDQILDCSLTAKQSTSKLEVDIGSGFILNRFQLEKNKTSTHANPGIEAIWQDERVRRQNLLKELETVPPLVMPQSQERPDVKPTTSEDFYRVGLQNKLQQLENPVDQSMNDTIASSSFMPEESAKEKKKTFNLKKLIANAVYPEECSQEDLLTNASFITNHFSNGSIFEPSNRFSKSTTTTHDSDDIFMDDTIVDEDLVRCLTQPDTGNQTLREEDMELLDVMQQLEEEEGENNIDLDSTLAPLSQNIDCNSPERTMQEKSSPNDSCEDDDDNDCLHDFTIVMDDMDELLLKLSQSSFPAIEQCDGADDILGTPKKNIRIRLPNTPTSITPKRAIKPNLESPRTPKSVAKKYAPLPLLIQSRSVKKNLSEATKQTEEDSLKTSINDVAVDTMDRKTPINELRKRRKSVSSQFMLNCENSPISKSKRRQTVDLDRTHITCKLRPIRRQSEVRLKMYNTQNVQSEALEFCSNEIDPTKLKSNLFATKEDEIFGQKLKVNIKKLSPAETVKGISEKLFSIEQQKYIPKSLVLSKEDGPSDGLNKSHIPSQLPSDVVDTIPKSKLGKISPRVELKRCSLINKSSPQASAQEHGVTPKNSFKSSDTTRNSMFGLGDVKDKNEHLQKPLADQPQTKSKIFVTSKEEKQTEETTCSCVLNKSHDQNLSSSNCTQNEIIHSPLQKPREKYKLSKISPRVELKRRVLARDINRSSPQASAQENGVTPKDSVKSSDTTRNSTFGLCGVKDNNEHLQTPLAKQPQTNSKIFVTTKEEKKTEKTTSSCSDLNKIHDQSLPSSNCTQNEIIYNPLQKHQEEDKSTPKIKFSKTSPRVKLKFIKNLNQNSHSQSSTDNDITPPENGAISSATITKDESTKTKSSSRKKNRLALKSRKQSKSSIIDQKVKHTSEESFINRKNIENCSYNDALNECKIEPEEPSRFKTKSLRVKLKRYKIKDTNSNTVTNKSPMSIKTSNEHSNRTPFSDRLNVRKFRNAVLGTSRMSRAFLEEPCKEIEDDLMMNSFCEHSFIVDSPVFSGFHDFQNVSITDCVIIKPNILTQTYEEVESNFKIHGIPDMVHPQPFYSNYLDVTSKKEVGHTVLSIPGRSLNDVENFKSSIPNLESFSEYRKKIIQAMTNQIQNEDRIREYLSTDKITIATPSILPPTKQDAKIWLKARELLKEKSLDEGEHALEEDSPIKVRRQKVVMLMETESDGISNDMDCSMRSVSLTPLTPVTVERNQTPATNNTLNFTPLTAPKSAGKRESRNTPRARVSLIKKLRDMRLSNVLEKCCEGEDGMMQTNKCVQSNDLLKISCRDDLRASSESLQSTETVSNEAVLAELEKPSFVKNLHNSQGSFDSSFGISNATLNNTFGFKVNLENLKQAKSDVEDNYLTTLSLEIFVSTRDNLLPNPQFDAISCIFYAIKNNISSSEGSENMSKTTGFIIISDSSSTSTSTKFDGIDSGVEIKEVGNEVEGLGKLLELCSYWDPDIFVGYEIEMSSWGYVMERAKYLDFNIAPLLSRVPTQKVRDFIDEDRDQLTDLDVETKLCGRILLDVWRLMRSEIALTSYTFENVMYHIMHRRCPLHTHKDLSKWFHSPQTKWIVLEYYLERVRGTLELLDQLDLIGRTSEMAKLIGIQFYEVLSRGSQFRVESMMLRIAKPRNLVPLSPSVQQRAHMRAPEYLPLILEPQSRFYPDPMIVLDFQSLYPSMIMAYNYCFSTCLGRVEHLGQSTPFEFGASQLRVSPKLLKQLMKNDMVTISPCGVVFVKKEVREGILPRMLSEILDTRQMVKQSMKLHKNTTALQRILHSRQLGLKLIANVTYGYTAANFSGRMPCVEVGDSVVAKGRETLERAIKLVESNGEWNAKVVYGDTDSLFVLVPGRSKTEAFKIGSEIAELVTQHNPQPVKLKLEKVYQPCILQTKKRYVGYMFESPDQKEPIYEAKGIETVRRDGCPAAVKMLEKTLRILFDSADVSQVKKYVCRQFTKLLSGKANIQDLIFAKEFRGLKGYKPTACVPALEMTRKWMQSDPRKIPRRGERVQFIVTNGPPGLPLIKLVRSPHDVLADEGLKINAIYYITKAIIPPLNRCLLLIGADVNEWFADLPRKILFTPALTSASEMVSSNASKKNTISQYFSSTNCITDCGRQTKEKICTFCSLDVSNSLVILEEKISKLQRGYFLTQFICQSCCGRLNSVNCASLDCPVLYVLEMKRRELNQALEVQNILNDRF